MEGCDTADAADDVTGSSSDGSRQQTGALTEALVREVASDTPTAARATLESTGGVGRCDRVSSILAAVGGGPHSGATVDVGYRLAEANDAWLDLFHVVPVDDAGSGDSEGSDDDDGGDANELLDSARDRVDGFDRVDRWLVEDETPASAIIEQSAYYDVVVVGSSTTGPVSRFVLGSTTDAVVAGADAPVVVVEAADRTPLLEE